jgi:hypothetical protein
MQPDWDDDDEFVDDGPASPDPPFDPMADLLARDRARNIADGQIALDILDLLAASVGEALPAKTLVAAEIGPRSGSGPVRRRSWSTSPSR